MRLHRLPCSIEAEARHCARREFAAARWNQLGRVGVDKRQREIMQAWIATDQKHARRARGKPPEVLPYFFLRYSIDPSFKDDLWRLFRPWQWGRASGVHARPSSRSPSQARSSPAGDRLLSP